ncbi:MAG: tyrosine-type recombinase/integrase [Peptostreptococcaceae bacterium]
MEWLNHYINYIKENKKLSQNTINSYEADIKDYIIYFENKDINPLDVCEGDILAYSRYLEENQKSISTISRKISSIRSFYDFLFYNKIIKKNPSSNIKKPVVSKKENDILSESEIDSLLKFKNLDTPKLIRDKAIFELLYGTGMKVTELAVLKVTDIDLEFDFIRCGQKHRIIPLREKTKKYLQLYIMDSREKFANKNQKYLFVNTQGNQFSRQGIWKIIKSYASNLRTQKSINPSMLRHSFAIHLLNKGAKASSVGKILGNNNVASLQSYVENKKQKKQKELDKKN